MATTILKNFIEFNGLTGEIIERALTADEIAERKATENVEKNQIAAKAAARQSALAKLAELGLTEEEIAAL